LAVLGFELWVPPLLTSVLPLQPLRQLQAILLKPNFP
jgi:hypothetical protein